MIATAVRDRPIIFGAESVRSILDGRKTQTRRVVKPQPRFTHYLQPMFGASPDGHVFGESGLWREVGPDYPDCGEDDRRCPFGAVGDRLWVREAFRLRADQDDRPPSEDWWKSGAWYQADGSEPSGCGGGPGKLRSPIHMPRWASRITLEVTDVRVERLQEITEADAIAEGCKAVIWSEPPWWQGYDELDGELIHQQVQGEAPPDWMIEPHKMKSRPHLDIPARQIFSIGWDRLNATRGYPWAESPWVWVIDFQVVAA